MRSRDYTKELKMAPSNVKVPLPIALAVLAGVFVVGGYLVREVFAAGGGHEAAAAAKSDTTVASSH